MIKNLNCHQIIDNEHKLDLLKHEIIPLTTPATSTTNAHKPITTAHHNTIIGNSIRVSRKYKEKKTIKIKIETFQALSDRHNGLKCQNIIKTDITRRRFQTTGLEYRTFDGKNGKRIQAN